MPAALKGAGDGQRLERRAAGVPRQIAAPGAALDGQLLPRHAPGVGVVGVVHRAARGEADAAGLV